MFKLVFPILKVIIITMVAIKNSQLIYLYRLAKSCSSKFQQAFQTQLVPAKKIEKQKLKKNKLGRTKMSGKGG